MCLLKTVIHVHTNYSFDSNVSPEQLMDTARRQGVDCVAGMEGSLDASPIPPAAIRA
jgi:histidinol phosphatase-like PHP family hydrolase